MSRARAVASPPRGRGAARRRGRVAWRPWLAFVLLLLWHVQMGAMAGMQITAAVQPGLFDDFCFAGMPPEGGDQRGREVADRSSDTSSDSVNWYCPLCIAGERPLLPTNATAFALPLAARDAPPTRSSAPSPDRPRAFTLPPVRAPPVLPDFLA